MKSINQFLIVFFVVAFHNVQAKDSLWRAIEKNNIMGLKKAIQKMDKYDKQELNEKFSYGRTPLMLAVANKNYEAIKILLEQWPNLEIKDNFSNTVLHNAVQMGDKEAVKMLLATESAPVNMKNGNGETPLILAADNGDKDLVKLFFEKRLTDDGIAEKVKIDEQDQNGKTALMHAAERGSKDVVYILINAGADLNITNKNGKTALQLAQNKLNKSQDEMEKAKYQTIIILLS